MTDIKISDLILHTVEQKPVDFKDTFDTLLKDRLGSAIDDKRQEIAKSLFNNSDVEEVEDEEDYEYEDDQEQEYEQESEEEDNG